MAILSILIIIGIIIIQCNRLVVPFRGSKMLRLKVWLLIIQNPSNAYNMYLPKSNFLEVYTHTKIKTEKLYYKG